MRIYKISCYSKCQSYFNSYLQSVTILAESEEQALEVFKASGLKFIYPQTEIRKNLRGVEYTASNWRIEDLGEIGSVPRIVDTLEESDY